MKAIILGADRRLHGLYVENQPTKIADRIRECPFSARRSSVTAEKQRLSIAASRRDREPKTEG
jgi:hypothetical protein